MDNKLYANDINLTGSKQTEHIEMINGNEKASGRATGNKSNQESMRKTATTDDKDTANTTKTPITRTIAITHVMQLILLVLKREAILQTMTIRNSMDVTSRGCTHDNGNDAAAYRMNNHVNHIEREKHGWTKLRPPTTKAWSPLLETHSRQKKLPEDTSNSW